MAHLASERSSLRRFFSGLTEQVFYTEIGMADPDVVGYLADLLCDFIRMDRIYCLRDAKGRRLRDVAEMAARSCLEPDAPAGERDRIVHRHVGDFTLFWTGVYPESLRRLRAPGRKDEMIDYVRQGKQSYAITSELTPEEVRPPGSLFRRLSDMFEFCVFGLREVRRNWESARLQYPPRSTSGRSGGEPSREW